MIERSQLRGNTPYDKERLIPAFLQMVASAKESIRIGIYGFTWVPLVDELIAAKQRGVDVKILFDHTQAMGPSERKQILRLEQAGFRPGVDFWVGTSPEAGQITHWKITVVDGVWVESGSFNYSASAIHQINFILIERDPEVAAKALEDWTKAQTFIIGADARYLAIFESECAALPAPVSVTVPAGVETVIGTPEAGVAVAAAQDTTVTIAPSDSAVTIAPSDSAVPAQPKLAEPPAPKPRRRAPKKT